MSDLKHEFWDRLDDVRAGMLGIKGQGRLVAMSPQVDDDVPGHIWFITAKGTDLATSTADGAKPAQFVVAGDGAGLYADVDGTLAQSENPQALEEVWNFMAEAWFEGGKQDPDVVLLKFTPATAEVSITPENGVKFLYEIAKAHVTGEVPDAGEQGTITF